MVSFVEAHLSLRALRILVNVSISLTNRQYWIGERIPGVGNTHPTPRGPSPLSGPHIKKFGEAENMCLKRFVGLAVKGC